MGKYLTEEFIKSIERIEVTHLLLRDDIEYISEPTYKTIQNIFFQKKIKLVKAIGFYDSNGYKRKQKEFVLINNKVYEKPFITFYRGKDNSSYIVFDTDTDADDTLRDISSEINLIKYK